MMKEKSLRPGRIDPALDFIKALEAFVSNSESRGHAPPSPLPRRALLGNSSPRGLSYHSRIFRPNIAQV